MFVRFLVLLALLVPVMAAAQPTNPREVSLELVANGTVTVPASRFTMSVEITATGDSQAAADANRDGKRADLVEALARNGVPATALTVPPASLETMAVETLNTFDVVPEEGEKPSFTSARSLSLDLATLEQVIAVRESIAKLKGVSAGVPAPQIGDREGLYRQAKIKALSSARTDADAYAREMGLRVVRVSRISETGNGMFGPGFQNFFQRMMTAGGPQGMKNMFESAPGTVRVDASIIVEFVLAP